MINEFKNEYRWLSNFWFLETPIKHQGLTYPTVEHFYVAMKTTDQSVREEISFIDKPGKCKRVGRGIELRDDWEELKLTVMRWATEHKYSIKNPTLRSKLIATGDQEIIEGNWWGDKFWGVCLKTGEGQNNLGKIIMEVRDERLLRNK